MKKEALKKIAIRLDNFRKTTQKFFFLFFLGFDAVRIIILRVIVGPFDFFKSEMLVVSIIQVIFLFLQGFLPWLIFKAIKVRAPGE